MILKILFLILIIFCGYLILPHYKNKIETFKFLIEHQFNNIQINKEINLDYENINFAVIRRASCTICGLFSN